MFEAAMGRVFHQVDMQDDVLDLAPFLMPRDMPLRSGFQVGTAMAAAMLVALVHPQAARAQAVDACGALDTSGHVTCSGDGNPYDDGITYQAPAAGDAFVDLSVVLADDFAMAVPAGLAAPAIDLAANGSASLTLDAEFGASIVSEVHGSPALRARSAAGDVLINAPSVTTHGDDARAIDARSLEGGTVHVIADGPVATTGLRSRGITAISTGGDVGISAGDVGTTGDYADGIIAMGDNVELLIGGDVRTQGSAAYGAYVRAQNGTAHVRVDGSVSTAGNGAKGIDAQATDGVSVIGSGTVATQGYIGTAVIARTDNGDALVDLARVSAEGPGASAVHAQSNTGNATIRVDQALSVSDHFATLDVHGGQSAHVEVADWVAAYGERAVAINVYSYGTVSAAVQDVLAVGNGATAIDAQGYSVELAIGGTIHAQSDDGDATGAAVTVKAGNSYYGASSANVTIVNDGVISAAGQGMGALRVDSAGSVEISGNGSVTTAGNQAAAVHIDALGDVSIALGNVETGGAFSDGIAAKAAGDVRLSIGSARVGGVRSNAINISALGDITAQIGDVEAGHLASTGMILDARNIQLSLAGDLSADRAFGHRSRGAGARLSAIEHTDASLGSVSVVGEEGIGVSIVSQTLDLDFGTLSVTGEFMAGIQADISDNAAVSGRSLFAGGKGSRGLKVISNNHLDVDIDTVSVSGETVQGVEAIARTASIIMNEGSLKGNGNTILDVTSFLQSAIQVGNMDVWGDNSRAVMAVAGGGIDLGLNGNITSSGLQSPVSDGVDEDDRSNRAWGVVTARSLFEDVAITNSGKLVASGNFNGGITAIGRDIFISGPGSVTTHGYGATAIYAGGGFGPTRAETGSADISMAEVNTSGENAVAVHARAVGHVVIDVDSITVTGDYSHAVLVDAVGGADIRVGNLAALGYDGRGVDLLGQGAGRFSVDIDRLIVAGGAGVMAVAPEGDVDIRVGELMQSGDTFQSAVYAAGRAVTVGLGELRTQGSNLTAEPLTAVLALGTESVDIEVHTLDARQSGRDGLAAAAVGTASVTITDGGSINTGGNAIALSAGRSGRVVNGGSISTFGHYARGIVAQSAGSLDIIGGNISTQGHYSNGITALALDSLAITSTVIVTEGVASNAIDAGSGGDIRISVGDLNVSGYGSQAVRAEAGGDIAIDIGGVVLGSAHQPLYDAVPVGDGGRLSDVSRGTITANAMGSASVTHNGAIITTGIREGGMSVRGEQGVTVSGNGSVSTRGTNATGVYAAANAGLASVEIGDVRTRGRDAFGVLVRSYGAGEATVDSVTTRGQGSHGVVVEGAMFASAKAGTVVTRGDNANGVVAHSYGDAYAAAESITVTGEGAIGLDVASYGSGDVEAVVGTVRAHHGRGVGAYASNGSATITAGRVIQSGPTGAEGILALGTTGAAITFGSVSSNGAADNDAGFTAAVAGGSTTGDVTIRGDRVSTRGDGRHGVVGRSDSGAIVAQVASVTTIGEASAFHLDTAGDVSLTTQRAISDGAESTVFLRGDDVNVVAGGIHANGAEGATALRVLASGDADVRVQLVQANGADRTGVLLAADGFAALTVDADGGILAGGDAVVLNADAGSSLRNDGTIMGGSGFALRAYGGAVSVDNRGLIAGALALTEGADLITNTGVLQLTAGTDLGAGNDRIVNNGAVILAGDVDFGAGNDSLVNNGVLVLGSSGMSTFAVAPMARTLIGLESFGNTALIDLRDDIVGDVLTISGSFAGSGNSTLGLDVAFGQQVAADRLVIGGAATGSTTIALSISGTPQLGLGPVLVQTGAGSSADAFALDPEAAVAGLIEHGLVFDAGNGRFTLATAPSATAYRLLNLTEAAQSLWLTTADTITAQLDSMRQAGSAKPGLWYAMHHSGMRRHEAGSFDAFGFEQQADIGYRQNVTGGQFGFDSGGDGFGFGVTAGYAKSSVNFLAGPERLDIESWNIGAYARYVGDLLFANALVKYDFYDIDSNLGTAGKAATDGKGYGAQGEAGLRFVAGGLSIEPVVGLSWQHVEADALVLPLRIDFDDREGGRASAGLRLVGTQTLGSDGDTQLRYYLRGDVVQPFAGSGITGFSDASDNVAFLDERIGTYGSARLGLSFTQGALTGFVEGEGRFSSEYRGGGGRVGLRIGF
ncbi:autotransporter outer membrane beta-barrel domain-containing protein [Altererythrobacter xixiisoli]|uniref:Autotransporter outer membrane beta-barrel domain-containing protein n=1 Tax=Croceibacterium xixiisoli TaxID=1476466 RepID=A0A6I4TS68_9SPHN|nr:autotransporter outer membrane beta-barrel domain-containing protein [Croceibacterium xixiisoli]MXO97980.1 autotransporter outer membrane beta-barrel domain-containing protein [Croceibacterium xixiisoli]